MLTATPAVRYRLEQARAQSRNRQLLLRCGCVPVGSWLLMCLEFFKAIDQHMHLGGWVGVLYMIGCACCPLLCMLECLCELWAQQLENARHTFVVLLKARLLFQI